MINSYMTNVQEEKKEPKKTDPSIDNAGLNMSGHVLIRDKDTKEELVNKRA